MTDFAFFISTEHQRVPGGIEVQANDVLKILNKMCIAGMFERLYRFGLGPWARLQKSFQA
jgi:hypothetical protein